MPSSHEQHPHTTCPNMGPREMLRTIVIKLSQAARTAGVSESTAAELREAAAALNRADPRFWGGGHGLPADELADLILAAVGVQARNLAGREPEAYVRAAYRQLKDADFRQPVIAVAG